MNRSLFVCHYRFRRTAHLDLILVTRSLPWTWKWGEGKGQFLHLLPKLNSEKSNRGHSPWGAEEMIAYLVKCLLSKYEVLSSDHQHPSKSQAQKPWAPHTCPCICTCNKQTIKGKAAWLTCLHQTNHSKTWGLSNLWTSQTATLSEVSYMLFFSKNCLRLLSSRKLYRLLTFLPCIFSYGQLLETRHSLLE